MILAIDMGNTNIVIGGIDEERTYFEERINTVHSRTSTEYALLIKDILELHGIEPSQIEGGILSSVVPPLNAPIQSAVKKVLGADFLHLLRCQHLGFSFEHFLPPCRRFAPARGSEKAALPDAKRPIVDWLFRFRSHNEQTPIPAG